MKNKNVIYTAIFGGKDVLHEPKFLPPNFDFVCFTDSNTLSSSTWSIRRVEAPFADPVRSARYYKVLAHRFLSEYEYSVWIDGNMVLIGDVNNLIKKYLSQVSLALYNHAYLKRRIFGLFWVRDRAFARHCIYDEADELIKRTESGIYMDNPRLIREQMARYKSEGYPKDNGLGTTMVLLRRHNDNALSSAMDVWWEEITKGSRRDQLSFNYAIWKRSLPFIYINEDARRNPYFRRVKHVKKWNPVM